MSEKKESLHDKIRETHKPKSLAARISEYKSIYSPDENAAKAREQSTQDVLSAIEYFGNIERKHFMKHRGEHKKFEEIPENYKLSEDAEKAHEEVESLLNQIAAEAMKRDLGEGDKDLADKLIKLYMDRGDFSGYIKSKGLDYDGLVKDLAKNVGKDIREMRDYQQFKEIMAKSTDKLAREIHDHEQKFIRNKDRFKSALEQEIKDYEILSDDIGRMIDLLKKYSLGKIDADFLEQNKGHFKKKAKQPEK